MYKKMLPYFILIVAIAFLSVSFCHAAEWDLISEKMVSKNNRVADIKMSNQDAAFQEFRFGAVITAIKIVRVIAYTSDGQKHEIKFQSYIKPGEFTPPFLFFEKGVHLTKIRLVYRARDRVLVKLYGKKKPYSKKKE